jgi:AraC family transcriptional regulator
MSVTEKALWTIERNLDGALTLDGIAEACGVSRFHLAHAFGQSTGHSVMQFVRSRRLSEAAHKLAAGAADILSLALESGYDSHEAFSRAFKARFGLTPETVRANATVDGLPLLDALRTSAPKGPTLAPTRYVDGRGWLAVGLKARHAFDAPQGIAGQWRQFMGSAFADIADRLDTIPIGLAVGVDADGSFDYVAAVEVARAAAVAAGLVKVEIAPCRWAVFAHAGHISSLSHTYAAIWDRWLPQHGRPRVDVPSIEQHRPGFDTRTGQGGVDIWIPLDG